MRAVLSLVAVAWITGLAGCGGGDLNFIGEPREDFQIPPQELIQKLEKSVTDDVVVRKMLLAVDNARPFKFAWSEFWEELSLRPFRSELYRRQSETIHEIHAKHCDSYPSFAKFLLSVGGDLEFIIGHKRRCSQPLPPRLARQALDAVANKVSTLDPELLGLTLSFLQSEVDKGLSTVVWSDELEISRQSLEVIGKALIDKKLATTYFSAIINLRASLGGNVVPADFFSDLISHSALL